MSLIVILGPTAVGKTKLAVQLALQLDAEIISADSRQVYRNMDLGTGKDIKEYNVGGFAVPHHLIDIKDASTSYNVFDFQQDFYKAYEAIIGKGKTVILCGGTGLYLEAALAKDQMIEVPVNESLRVELAPLNQEELVERLQRISSTLHNNTDLVDRDRTIRAMEIEEFKKRSTKVAKSPVQKSIVIGLKMDREKIRTRIGDRLKVRLDEGMIEEVQSLLKQGVSHEQLNYYGLEYRFLSNYVEGKMNHEEMFDGLVQAIRRFAKKQMTWYRRMEKKGQKINWINAEEQMDVKVQQALKLINKQ
ncbi:MAG: tRNA dimethylallyltransferase [Vicingaceae bacterium]|jgi:tRNA dimethylallyltransferase